MIPDFKKLLAAGDALPDIYELFARPRLDPDREGLQRELATAVSQLTAWHSQSDGTLLQRAIRWHRELCGWQVTFREDDRYRAHEQEVIADLTRQYASGAGADPSRWQAPDLERWLRVVRNVAADRVAEIARAAISVQQQIAREAQGGQTETLRQSTSSSGSTARPSAPAARGGLSWKEIAAKAAFKSAETSKMTGRVGGTAAQTPSVPADVSAKPPVQDPGEAQQRRDAVAGATRTPPVQPAEIFGGAHSRPLPPAHHPGSAPMGRIEPERGYPRPKRASMGSGARALWIIGAILLGGAIPLGVGVWILSDRINWDSLAQKAREENLPSFDPSAGPSPNQSTPNSTPPPARAPVPSPTPKTTPDSNPAPSDKSPTSPPSKSPNTPTPDPSDTPDSDPVNPTPTPGPTNVSGSTPAQTPNPTSPGQTPVPSPGPTPPAKNTPPSKTPSKVPSKPAPKNPPNPPAPAPVAGPTVFPMGYEAPLVLTHTSPAAIVAWSSDGKWLATADASPVVRVWEAATGNSLHELKGHSGAVTALAWNDERPWLASGSEDGSVRVWRLEKDLAVTEIKSSGDTTSAVTAVAWDSGHSAFWYGTANGGMYQAKSSSGETWTAAPIKGRLNAGVHSICRTGLGERARIAITYSGGVVGIWKGDLKVPDRMLVSTSSSIWQNAVDPEKSKPGPTTLAPFFQKSCFAAALNHKSNLVALACGDVEIWRLDGPLKVLRQRLMPGYEELQGYRCAAWSLDDKYLAAGDGRGRLGVWDAVTGKLFTMLPHGKAVTSVTWGSAATVGGAPRLAAACEDGSVRVWELKDTPTPSSIDTIEQYFTQARKFKEEENFAMLHRAVLLIQSQSFSPTQRFELGELQTKLKEQSKEDLTKLKDSAAGTKPVGAKPAKKVELDASAVPDLMTIIDWDSEGAGVEALELLKKTIPTVGVNP